MKLRNYRNLIADIWPAALTAAAAITVGIILAALFTALTAPETDPLEDARLHTVEVTSGDTWWTLAEPCGEALDKRLVIQLLQDRSGATTDLHPGDEILTCAEEIAS